VEEVRARPCTTFLLLFTSHVDFEETHQSSLDSLERWKEIRMSENSKPTHRMKGAAANAACIQSIQGEL
jgi:hypothetical protein